MVNSKASPISHIESHEVGSKVKAEGWSSDRDEGPGSIVRIRK